MRGAPRKVVLLSGGIYFATKQMESFEKLIKSNKDEEYLMSFKEVGPLKKDNLAEVERYLSVQKKSVSILLFQRSRVYVLVVIGSSWLQCGNKESPI